VEKQAELGVSTVIMHLVMKCQAMNVELHRQKVFEECRLKYTRVLGSEWGEEAKVKAARRLSAHGIDGLVRKAANSSKESKLLHDGAKCTNNNVLESTLEEVKSH